MTKLKSGSFAYVFPEMAKEWDPDKNGQLSPDKVKPHSNITANWICPICGKKYTATVAHRAQGSGCPMCGIRKSADKRSKKVAMIDTQSGETIFVFNSISEASRERHISSGNIAMVCQGKRKKPAVIIGNIYNT